jgi:glycosyltransferase involved in cell wall biosynthesis
MREANDLAARAKVHVLPIGELRTAAGQVTLVTAMAMGQAIVATRCAGTEDYVTDGDDALLVEPFDSIGMANAIATLLSNDVERTRLGARAQERWEECFSDGAAGVNLASVLGYVTERYGSISLSRGTSAA